MTRGTIKNKETGLEILGDVTDYDDYAFLIKIDGTSSRNTMSSKNWDFTPEAEPIKEGIYVSQGVTASCARIYKYREGTWRDAEGFDLPNQDVDASRMVRLVPKPE